ncbi:MAG: zf-HC2 domain-containing protein, partial [Planctomycetaceae bacterium]
MNRQTPKHSPDERPDPDHSNSPDRLLSAYLDGELTAEETQAVETHLEHSETARHTLDELRSLSNFLNQLQPESAPQALHNTLLNSPQPTPQPTRRTQRRPWIAAAAALTSVAALVMLALVPQWSPWSSSPTASVESDMATDAKTPSSSFQLAMSDTATASDASGAGFGSSATNTPKPPNDLLFNSTPDNAEVGQILSAIDTSGDQA